MKSWKEQLNDELDRLTPPFSAIADELPEQKRQPSRPPHRRKISFSHVTAIAASFVAICAVALAIFLPQTGGTVVSKAACVTVDINPSLAFLTDDDGSVKRVVALNADGDLVLSDEEYLNSLTEKPLNDAVQSYVDRAVQLGFIDLAEEAKITFRATEDASHVLNDLDTAISDYLTKNQAKVAIDKIKLTQTEFSNLFNVSEKDALNQINQLPIYFTQREIDGMTEEQLREKYRNEFFAGDEQDKFTSSLQTVLQENIEILLESIQQLEDIESCNEEIKSAPENPFNLDFWTLEHVSPALLPESLRSMMHVMKEKLDAYANLGAKPIENIADLERALLITGAIPVETLQELCEPLSRLPLEIAEQILSLLENIGLDTTNERDVLNTPKTQEDYLKKVLSIYKKQSDDRMENVGKAPNGSPSDNSAPNSSSHGGEQKKPAR